jgi:hypothetical protein
MTMSRTSASGYSCLVWATLSVAILGCGLAPGDGFAEEVDRSQIIERIHRPSFEFEQCSNLCTIAFDETFFRCAKGEIEKSLDVAVCWTDAKSTHESCLRTCPPDIGSKIGGAD